MLHRGIPGEITQLQHYHQAEEKLIIISRQTLPILSGVELTDSAPNDTACSHWAVLGGSWNDKGGIKCYSCNISIISACSSCMTPSCRSIKRTIYCSIYSVTLQVSMSSYVSYRITSSARIKRWSRIYA